MYNSSYGLSDYYGAYNSWTYNFVMSTFGAPTNGTNITLMDNIEGNGAIALKDLFVDEVRYVLKDGTPPKNAGSDGTDMGLYGGAGYKGNRIPAYPSVKRFDVGGATAADGKLKVNITAETEN